MAFALLCLTIFIMFFQPVSVWPLMAPYQPLRNSAIAALAIFLFSARRMDKPFFSVKTNKYFVLFVMMQIMSSFVICGQAGFETFNLWLRLGIVYYLIVKSVTQENQVKAIAFFMVAAIAYLSYYSISRFIIGYQPGVRSGGFGWYENPNDLSIILVTVIPLALLLVNTARSPLTKAFCLCATGTFAFNILFTGSRNGLLGLASVGILSILASNRISRVVRGVLLSSLFISIATIGVANVIGRGVSGFRGDDSSENRIEQWKAGMRMIKGHPFLGVGPGEFISNVRQYDGIPGLEPHNTLVKVFTETGILGGMFYMLFSFYPLYDARQLVRKYKGDKNSTAFKLYQFIAIGLVGFWVCAFFSNRYQYYILYVLVALAVAVRANLMKEYNEVGENIQ